MVVLIMERAPIGLRGELSRWMIEPRGGVFVGRISAMVRDKLWEKACKSSKAASVVMLYTSASEQGFSVRSHGDPTRTIQDWEGLALVHVPHRPRDRPIAAVKPTTAAEIVVE